MRKIIISLHTSLDGFVAGPNGEMDWIKFDDDLFDFVGTFTEKADTALYGRKTYQIMDAYWPTAADQPNAGKHEREHSAWYQKVEKVVISNTMKEKKEKTTFIGGDIKAQIVELKNKPGKDILIFGSPTAAHELMKRNLIDEFWLFVNPVLIGHGIPAFENIQDKTSLEYLETKDFKCGVVGLHHMLNK
jgi:dihydrofolate reductase